MKYYLLTAFLFSLYSSFVFGQEIVIEETKIYSEPRTSIASSCKINDHILVLGTSYDGREAWIKKVDFRFNKSKHIDISEKNFIHLDNIIPVPSIGYLVSKHSRDKKKSLIKAYNHDDQFLWKFETTNFEYSNAFIDPNNSNNLILYGEANYPGSSSGDTCRIFHFDLQNKNLVLQKDLSINIRYPSIQKNDQYLFITQSILLSGEQIQKFNFQGELKWTKSIDFLEDRDFPTKGSWVINEKGNIVFIVFEFFSDTKEDYVFYEYTTDNFTRIKKMPIQLSGSQYVGPHWTEQLKLSIDENNQYLLYNSQSRHTSIFNSSYMPLGEYTKNISPKKALSIGNNKFILIETPKVSIEGEYVHRLSLSRCNLNLGTNHPLESPKIWTVLVGVSRYDNLPHLDTPDDHTQELARHLESTHYSDNVIEPLIDRAAKSDDILAVMNEVFNNNEVRENDLLFFFFSGHGVIRNNDQGNPVGVLCSYEFDDSNPNTYLTHDDIMEVVNKSPAKHKIVMIEACQDNLNNQGHMSTPASLQRIIENKALFDKQRGTIPAGTILITSCKEGERSIEDDKIGAIFSHFLLKGINEGLADGYGGGRRDDIITAKEIYTYIKAKVDNHCKENNLDSCQTTTISPSNYQEDLPIFYLN